MTLQPHQDNSQVNASAKAGATADHTGNLVAVVTGAGRGIGKALLQELTGRGYTVIAVVRNADDVTTLKGENQRVQAICADVCQSETEGALRQFLESHVDKVDLLINNAGHGASGYGIEGLKYEELDKVLNVHCYGPIRCIKACMPFLRKSKQGAIVNISSRFGSTEWVATGKVPHDQATYPYRIAKAAMNMLTSCLSIELRDEKIKVLSVDPGKVRTRFGPRDADTEPEEAAKSIVDLLSNVSDTGLFLHASGERLPW